jgi:site-specific DNA recombinase
MRVAIYARYSSDLQDASSIADQVALANDYASTNSWQMVATFTDAPLACGVREDKRLSRPNAARPIL